MKIENEFKPIVSIIVPTYNHVKYIRQAMDSIFMQEISYSYEVIVGDDASTDGTENILKEYAEQYPDKIRLFLREQNLGATKNVYELMMTAKGKYIAYLEGDDYWTDSHKLQKQIDFLENNPQFIGVCHKFATVDSEGNPIKKNVEFIKHKKIFALNDYKLLYLPSQASTFVRRNIYLDKTRDFSFLYKTDSMVGDQTETLLYLSKGDFYCLDDIMGVYRIATNPDSSSITKTLYRDNRQNAIEMDLEFTKKLEQLVKDEFSGSVDATLRKKELYTSAIIRCFKTFSLKKIGVLKQIRGEKSKISFLAYVPVGIWKRIVRKIKKK